MSQNPNDPSRPTSTQGPPPGGYGAPAPYPAAPAAPPAQAAQAAQYGLPPSDPSSPEMRALKERIGMLQKLYLFLFLGSLGILVASYTIGIPPIGHVAWALTLGGAVITRIKRQGLVNQYNAALAGGRPAPLT
jgi:hypothetical protein